MARSLSLPSGLCARGHLRYSLRIDTHDFPSKPSLLIHTNTTRPHSCIPFPPGPSCTTPPLWVLRIRPTSYIAHVLSSSCSMRFDATAQLTPYRTPKLFTKEVATKSCMRRVTHSCTVPRGARDDDCNACPHAQGTSSEIALHSMSTLSALTRPACNTELLADTQPYAFFDDILSEPASRCPASSACVLAHD
jgi:hypothetical protein